MAEDARQYWILFKVEGEAEGEGRAAGPYKSEAGARWFMENEIIGLDGVYDCKVVGRKL